VAFVFLRRDLLEDPAHRARFREKYGRELAPPRTWRDYQQQVEYFTQPDKGLFGAAEPRERLTGWMFWLPRYLSAAAPNQFLFDDQMKPLIDSPAGVAATESYIATVSHSPPAILGEGNDYSYTLPFFLRGNAYATMLTVATAKISQRDTSGVKGKVMSVPMPGNAVGGRLVRRTMFIYGNNLVIPRTSPSKELAFLFAMWLTDAENSVRSVAANGIADPYRHNHLREERVGAMYTPQPLALLKSELPFTAPSGTGLPGDKAYLAALSDNIWLAASGRMTAKEAMSKTAREWNAITEKYGRAKQIAHWRAFKQNYPTATEPLPR
jgi:multiple sugar transport system substrate-binding protein